MTKEPLYLLTESELKGFRFLCIQHGQGESGMPKLPEPLHVPSNKEIENHYKYNDRIALTDDMIKGAVIGAKSMRDKLINKK